MKALVTYLSQTGNTGKIAEAIFDELSCEKDLKKIDEIKDLNGYDIIFAGFPVWQFGPAEPARKFLAEHSAGKKIALFVTHAMDPSADDKTGIDLLKIIIEKCKSAAGDGELIGFFNCQGELSQNIAEFLLKNNDPEMRKFGGMRSHTLGHPDCSEIKSARNFANEILKKYL